MMTYMIIGAPMMGVMALSGNRPLSPGRQLMRLHNKAITEPHSNVVGMSER